MDPESPRLRGQARDATTGEVPREGRKERPPERAFPGVIYNAAGAVGCGTGSRPSPRPGRSPRRWLPRWRNSGRSSARPRSSATFY